MFLCLCQSMYRAPERGLKVCQSYVTSHSMRRTLKLHKSKRLRPFSIKTIAIRKLQLDAPFIHLCSLQFKWFIDQFIHQSIHIWMKQFTHDGFIHPTTHSSIEPLPRLLFHAIFCPTTRNLKMSFRHLKIQP